MQQKTVIKILNNDEELDIAKMAEAVLVQQEKEKKRKRPASMKRSWEAWQKIKAKQKDDEAWRQKLSKVWNKNKKS